MTVVVLADPPLNWGMTEFYYVKDDQNQQIKKTKKVLIVVVLADPPLNWGMTEFYYVKDGQKRKNKF